MAVPLSYNVRNLLVRRWTSAFTAGGIALVVAATMLLSALVTGLQQMLVSAGEPDNLVVHAQGRHERRLEPGAARRGADDARR